MRTVVMLAALVGCEPGVVAIEERDRPDKAEVDLRREFPPLADGGVRLVTPEYVIEPHSEVEWCWFTTWTAPSAGLHGLWSYQSRYGHHVVPNATDASLGEHPDGSVVDCTDPDALLMTSMAPLFLGGSGNVQTADGPDGGMVLPDGMAVALTEGQRILLQSHYVNPTDDPIRVQDAIDLTLVEPDTVDTWAAPFVHVALGLEIPPGPSSLTFDCAWDDAYQLLFLAGHMHEHGAAFSNVLTPAGGGSPRTLYDVPQWDPSFRDAAPVEAYAPGELAVRPGDVMTTTCEWDNPTDHVMGFPEEMCVTFGMAYPLEAPIVCQPR